MEHPKLQFSVIIPLYNKEISIYSTINSVLSQSYFDYELIIVNDGSTDDSLAVVQSFSDKRIKIVNKPNDGVSSARNRGIELAEGQFLVFLDADDIWLPSCLQEFNMLAIEFPLAEVLCTNYNMTGKNLIGSERRYYIQDYSLTSAFFLAKWGIPIMLTGCVAVKRDLFKEIGFFDQSITHGEDVEMWDRLAKRFRIAKSERVTTIYRTESENRASLLDEKSKKKAERIPIKRTSAKSKSQKILDGVQIVTDLSSFTFSKQGRDTLINLVKFPDRVLTGLFFIIKVRFFRYNYIQ